MPPNNTDDKWYQSIRLHTDMVPPMTNAEVAMRTSNDILFETARTDANYNVLISAWKVALNDKGWPSSGQVTAGVNDEPNVEN